MKLVTLLLSLLASTAFAQPAFLGSYSRLGSSLESSFNDGGVTFKGSVIFGTDAGVPYVYDGTWWAGEMTGTQSARTLYVDPTGSDNNTCVASGTAACATLGGALFKLPIQLNHAITINVATGSYTGNVIFPAYQMNGGSITITGTRVAPTLTSGTTSGSLTATSTDASAATGAAVFTDSGQSWTANDLREKFFEITSGVLSGTICPIISNTATAVTTSCGYGATTGSGTTYVIRTPGPVISGVWNILGVTGRVTNGINVSDVKMTANAVLSLGGTTTNFTCTNCLIESTAGTGVVVSSRGSFTRSTLTANGGVALTVGAAVLPAFLSISGSFIRNSGTGVGVSIIGPTTLGAFDGVVQGDPTAGSALVNISRTGGALSPTTAVFPLIIQCAGVELGAGLYASSSIPNGHVAVSFHGPRVEGCPFGVILHQAVMSPFTALVFSSTTTSLTLDRRAFVDLTNATMSFSGSTTDISIDGDAYTNTFFTGLSPKSILGPRQSFLYSP